MQFQEHTPTSKKTVARRCPSPASAFASLAWMLLAAGFSGAQVVRQAETANAEEHLAAAWPGPWKLARESETLALPGEAPHELQDFALSFRLSLEKAPGGDHALDFAAMEADGGLWLKLAISPTGHLLCSLAGQDFSLVGGPLTPGSDTAILVNIRRDARQALCGLWMDGVEQASAVLKPGRAKLADKPLHLGLRPLSAVLSDVKLFSSALNRPQVLNAALRSSARPRLAPFAGRLDLIENEVIAVLGGSEAVAMVEEGSFEALLLRAFAAQRPRLRSLAWEADTVFRQDRPLNFGDVALQLRRCGATCVLLMFGRQECLEHGAEGVADFEATLEKLLAQVVKVTPRLVIAEAAPFERKAPPLPDLTPKNQALALYNQALRRLAEKHGAFFASSGEGWDHERPQPLTSDGVNFTQAGAREAGLRLLTAASALDRPEPAALLTAVREKNRLWQHYWRPDNWAFLHGDRTAQPSSRDHLNPQLRWFPAELERYQKLIADKEEELWKLAEPPKVP